MEDIKVNSVIIHVESGKKFMVAEIFPNGTIILAIELENMHPGALIISEDEILLGHYKLEEAYGVLN